MFCKRTDSFLNQPAVRRIANAGACYNLALERSWGVADFLNLDLD
jgi:hypothetical protein